jgi:hypothetical protein
MTRMANRVHEMSLFEALLERQCQKRILLVKAPSGYGKSELIDRFTQIGKNQADLTVIILDLADSTAGIAYLISRLQRKLKPARFPNYDRSVRQFLVTPNIEMSDIEIEGNENTLQILLNVDEQQIRLNQLEQAFFGDLAAIKMPVLLLIDTFEKAPDELQNWISGQFLGEVAENLEGFRVVVAGQEVPQSRADWRTHHHCCELGSIQEVDVWYDYVQARKIQLTRDFVSGIVCAFRGQPRNIAEMLEFYREGQP